MSPCIYKDLCEVRVFSSVAESPRSAVHKNVYRSVGDLGFEYFECLILAGAVFKSVRLAQYLTGDFAIRFLPVQYLRKVRGINSLIVCGVESRLVLVHPNEGFSFLSDHRVGNGNQGCKQE